MPAAPLETLEALETPEDWSVRAGGGASNDESVSPADGAWPPLVPP